MSSGTRVFKRRMAILLGAVSLWSGVIVFKLVDLQILRNASMRKATASLHRSTEEMPAIRGEILDRRGKILGISRQVPFLFADPSLIDKPDEVLKPLARLLKKDKRWVKEKRKALAHSKRRFAYLAHQVSEQICAEIEELDLKGVYVGSQVRRKYPSSWIGSHVLGFTNRDGSVKEGLELAFDDVLRGKPGRMEVFRDGRRRRMGLNTTVLEEPVMGAQVTLTIDANIQLFVEDALRRGARRFKAKNLTAIVMDVPSGAILAMANMPDFNPNRFYRASSFDRKNRAIVDVYEPASAFKIVTAAAALDVGAVDLDDRFDCERGGIRIHDKFIRDHKPFGILNVREILWQSSNVGAIKIAQQLPEETFYKYIQAFGFGKRTGIDLPAEAEGILHELSDWSKVSSAFLSIGHEISSTPLQMLLAASVVANDGKLVKPYVASKVVYHDGREADIRPKNTGKRVISSRTAQLMRGALTGVVEQGTAKAAAIPGVGVFGKTGTAQRLKGGSYSRDKFNASFVGFFPAEAPKYGMIIVVHDPKGPLKHGGDVAAPVFGEIGSCIMAYDRREQPKVRWKVFAGTPHWVQKDLELPQSKDVMPDLAGLGLRNLLYQCSHLGIKPQVEGEGRVIFQEPRPGETLPANRKCRVVLGEG